MSFIANKVAKKVMSSHAQQYEPEDPHYVTSTDAQGRKKRQVRPVPPGLSKKDEKILKKIRKRAHYLDKGMNLCGFRVGWTFFIGFIPLLGDLVNIMLNYNLIVKLAKKLDLPESIMSRIYVNNAVAAGVGFVPLVGDVALAVWKANSRNAHLIEAFLTKRGQKNLASLVQGPGSGQAQAHVGNGAGTYNHSQNAPITNAEVDQIVADSSRAGTATPPIQPQSNYQQSGLRQQGGQQQGFQQQGNYQPRVKQQR